MSNYKHGLKKHPLYCVWESMKARCYNKNNRGFKNYGGRGIFVCEKRRKYDGFIADMGRRPTNNHMLDRINNDDGYYKENCRWATRKEQASNRSTNIFITYNGKTQTIMDWETELGMNRNTLYSRISRGWDVKEAIETPVNTKSFI